jgi:hypothetical protein
MKLKTEKKGIKPQSTVTTKFYNKTVKTAASSGDNRKVKQIRWVAAESAISARKHMTSVGSCTAVIYIGRDEKREDVRSRLIINKPLF